MIFQIRTAAFTSLVVAFLLSGCSVKPEPLDEQTIKETAIADRAIIHASQEPIDRPLSLSEAMARAVKYNLENRMQMMAEAMAESSYELVKLDMLPILGATAGYFDRQDIDASRSFNILNQTDNFSYSTSQDLQFNSADLTFSFNILDFGLSYLTARQEGDRFLVSNLGRRKVVLRLLEQTRGAYWRAVAMQSIRGDLDEILLQARQSLAQLRLVRESQLASPQVVLQDIRAMLEMIQQMEDMQQTVQLAMIELTTLINEAPGSAIELAGISNLPPLPTLPDDLEALELSALANSADYVGELYNVRIDQLESRKALIRLLPGLEFSYAANYSSNSYLYNNNWGLAGIRLTGNLSRFLAYGALTNQGEAREQLSLARRLTMNMAVLTGVHLSWQQYANNIDKFGRATEIEAVDIELSDLAGNSLENNATSGVSRIQTKARALRSTLSKLMSYADLQAAYGSFLTSLSLDPVPQQYQLLPVDELAPVLAESYARWESGEYPGLIADEELLATESAPNQDDNTVLAVAVEPGIEVPVVGASDSESADAAFAIGNPASETTASFASTSLLPQIQTVDLAVPLQTQALDEELPPASQDASLAEPGAATQASAAQVAVESAATAANGVDSTQVPIPAATVSAALIDEQDDEPFAASVDETVAVSAPEGLSQAPVQMDDAPVTEQLDEPLEEQIEVPAEAAIVPAANAPVESEFTATVSVDTVQDEVSATLSDWMRSWETQDSARYLSYYEAGFEPVGGASVQEWLDERKRAVEKPQSIEAITLSGLEQDVINEEMVRATFWLHYKSNNYQDETRKELLLKKVGNTWKIIGEKNREVIYR